MDFDPDSFSVSTWPRRTRVENSSPSRTTHSAAVAPPAMARATMSWARLRRSVSSFGFRVSSCVVGIDSLIRRGGQQQIPRHVLAALARLRPARNDNVRKLLHESADIFFG